MTIVTIRVKDHFQLRFGSRWMGQLLVVYMVQLDSCQAKLKAAAKEINSLTITHALYGILACVVCMGVIWAF